MKYFTLVSSALSTRIIVDTIRVTLRPERVYNTCNCRGIRAPSAIVIFLGVVIKDEIVK